ncbi:FUSC family protein [Arthrobacter castelli]|uniref:FUSC family protein n=1 Tax=Arthrobacter castelli TaxID=271431 RepID=UPI00138AAFC8|nr:FUSC family protein [Arthrobacter castelli]
MRDFFTMAPSQRDHYPAARIALGIAVPLLVVLAIGRIDLTIFAAFGAFSGIYAKAEIAGRRFQHQSIAGFILVACLGLGGAYASIGASPWAIVITTAVVAGAGSVAADYWRLKPPGSLFFVFAFAAVASLPEVPPWWQALTVGTASVLWCLFLGAVPAVVRKLRRSGDIGARLPASERPAPAQIRPDLSGPAPIGPAPQQPVDWSALMVHALRYAVAAAIAGGLATFADIGHSYWAMVAAVVPIAAPTLAGRLARAVHRIVGTLGGVAVTAAILALPLLPWHIVLLLVVLQFLAEMFVQRHYTVALFFITPLALLMSFLVTQPDPADLLVDRTLETVIGALVGVAVVVLMRERAASLKGPETVGR